MLELYQAAMLLIIAWDADAGTALFRIVESCRRWSDRKPFIEKIRAINTIITKDAKYRSLDGILRDLRRSNPDMKEYSFDRLRERLYSEAPSEKVYL